MGQPAAKKGDTIVGIDNHLVRLPNGVVVVMPLPFNGPITDQVSSNVKIMGAPAATVGSIAKNTPEHKLVIAPPGQPLPDLPAKPNNEGRIKTGSGTVRINGQPAARLGDTATTCRDQPGPEAQVVAAGSVRIG